MNAGRPAVPKRGPKKWTEKVLKKRTAAGLGVGEGASYQPAIRVQDFSSKGVQSRIPSQLVGRTVHVHSHLERAFFLVKEFSGQVVDFLEQYPMDRAVTLGAAQRLAVQHPKYPGGQVPVVMTLDAVVVERVSNGTKVEAWDIKPTSELSDPRVQEKLSLHRAYCAHFGIPHRLFTEQSIPKDMVRSIEWMRTSLPQEDETLPTPDLFTAVAESMRTEVLSDAFKKHTIRSYCQSFDERRGLPWGCGLRVFQYLGWTRQLKLNLRAAPVELQSLNLVRKLTRQHEAAQMEDAK